MLCFSVYFFFFFFFFFKQKTAYEIRLSLVGSEHVEDDLRLQTIALHDGANARGLAKLREIRHGRQQVTRHLWSQAPDRIPVDAHLGQGLVRARSFLHDLVQRRMDPAFAIGVQILKDRWHVSCLLYTSDAADDLLCVDLGG